jgi:ABC-type dipeptide/oligopeptide/nickel transport system ATPase component
MKNVVNRPGMPLILLDSLTLEIQHQGQKYFPVRNVSFFLEEAKTLAIVGESGSGKTLTALALLNLLPENTKQIGGIFRFEGQVVQNKGANSYQTLRGKKISIVFQDPHSALNPVFKIGTQFQDILKSHFSLSSREIKDKIFFLFKRVGFSNPIKIYRAYPYQLSGGMAQRVMLALALACEPQFIIADEPTTALDVTTQGRILELIQDLQEQYRFALLFITHDIALAVKISDYLGVMFAGELVEFAKTEKIVCHPCHNKTKELIKATRRLGVDVKGMVKKKTTIFKEIPVT